jgi:tetratricopeptide (TPR) repeat protein
MPHPFPESQPAPDVETLLDFLKKEDNGHYLYRGQTKHYGNLLPSVFRRARDNSAPPTLGRHNISSTVFNNTAEAEHWTYKFWMMERCIQHLGRGLGNIVAQQYGFGSEAIDVTSDIDIAGFFAARAYPNYDTGPSDTPIGVIYRFNHDQPISDVPELESRLGGIGHQDDGSIVWFRVYVKESDLDDNERAHLQDILDQLGKETLELGTCPVLVEYASIIKPLITVLKRWRVTPRDFKNTRLARQKGGFLRPRIFWNCTIAKERLIIPKAGTNYYEPSIARADELVAIEDPFQQPGCEAFFFRHGDTSHFTLSREYLWPGETDDDVYECITDWVHYHPTMREYLEREGIWMDHPTKGIIDRGYYTGAEEHFFHATQKYRNGDYAGAIDAWTRAIAINPLEDQQFVLRAEAYCEIGERDLALQDLAEAIRLNDKNWNPYHNRAVILNELGRHDESLAAFDGALKRRPHSSETYLERGVMWGERGNDAAAMRDINAAWKYATGLDRPLLARILTVKALTLTAAGRHQETTTVLAKLGKMIDTTRLRAQLVKMRAQGAARNKQPVIRKALKKK